MSGTAAIPDPGGVPLAEAAARLGLSVKATRKRAQRGTLPAYTVEDHWYILLVASNRERVHPSRTPPAAVPDNGQDIGQDIGQDAIEAHYRVAGESALPLVPLQTIVEELRSLAGELAPLAQRNEALALEVGQLRERAAHQEGQLIAKDETIAELGRRAEAAERECEEFRERHDALRAAAVFTAPPAAPAATSAADEHEHDLVTCARWGAYSGCGGRSGANRGGGGRCSPHRPPRGWGGR